MSAFFPDDPAREAEYRLAATTILCDCGCHPQSVHDCACGRADAMRREIAASIGEGKSGEAVIAAYVAEHGEKIRVAPTATGFSLLAWIAPGTGFLVAALLIVALLRRWRRATEPVLEVAAPVSPELRERLDRELRDLDR